MGWEMLLGIHPGRRTSFWKVNLQKTVRSWQIGLYFRINFSSAIGDFFNLVKKTSLSIDSLSNDCLGFSIFRFFGSKICYLMKNQWNINDSNENHWYFIDFLQNTIFLEAKNQKIKNPRQSLDKESIERDDFFDRIKKSSIAEEKELVEDRLIC